MSPTKEEAEVLLKVASIPISQREVTIQNTVRNLPVEEALKVEGYFRKIFLILDQEAEVFLPE